MTDVASLTRRQDDPPADSKRKQPSPGHVTRKPRVRPAAGEQGSPAGLVVRLLGPVVIGAADRAVAPVAQPMQRVLLGLLATARGRAVSIDALIDGLWGEEWSRERERNLHSQVSALRRRLSEAEPGGGPSRLERSGGGYRLALHDGDLDAGVFRQLARDGREAARAGDVAGAAASFDRALGLWRGPALADAAPLCARLTAEAASLEELRAGVAEERAECHLALGRHLEAVAELSELAAEHPGRERLTGLLMVALWRCGRRGDALAAFDRTRRALAEALGLDPGPGLRDLHARVLIDDPSLAGAAAAGTGGSIRPATAPAMLPPGPRWFTGRDAELAVLDRALHGVPDADGGPGGPVLAAVTGTAGAGKTTLALYWAHRAAPRFPGGQLYVNLRGYDPAGPASTAEAVAGLLDALGVPTGRVPPAEGAMAGLYRQLVAGQRMLIVLDNAAGPAHVRPLLPPGQAAMVLVTSRSAMTGLAAADGAVLVPLGLLDRDESADLLAARLGPGRLAAEPGAAGQIAEACAGLPLALAVTGARAAAPGRSLAAIADQLTAAADAGGSPGGALDVLETGEEATSVRAVFSWSVRQLSEPAARMFRLLGVHPGPDISAAAAASLAGIPARQARRQLAELTAASLVTEQRPGRYFFHDLLRSYAAEQAQETETDDARDAAARRVIGYYMHHSYQAGQLIWPAITRFLRDPPAQPEGTQAPTISTQDAALAWYQAEQQVLPQVLAWAARLRLDSQVVQLRVCLEPYEKLRFMAAVEDAALAAAERLGDNTALAQGNYAVGSQAWFRGAREEAAACYQRALDHAELAGDLDWQAMAERALAGIAESQGRVGDAVEHAWRAVGHARAAGAREAEFLTELGYLQSLAGEAPRGLAICRDAVARLRTEGDPIALSLGLANLGESCRIAEQPGEAVEHLREATELLRQVDAVYLEAGALKSLGDAYAAEGASEAARAAWQRALDIYNELAPAVPDVGEIRARLSQSAPAQ